MPYMEGERKMKKYLIILCLSISVCVLCGCDKTEYNNQEELEAKDENVVSEQTEESLTEEPAKKAEKTESKEKNTQESIISDKTSKVKAPDKSEKQNNKKKDDSNVDTPLQETVIPENIPDTANKEEKPKPEETHTHISVGNMGWFNSKEELESACINELDKWGKLWENNQISDDEYFSKCPSGYEGRQCSCGKWTGDYKYDN